MRYLLALSLVSFSLPCFAATAEVDFQRDIQPIFAEHCLECHGPDKAKGGLALSTRDAALKELKSGARAVVPGRVVDSELITRMVTTDKHDVMPPKEKAKRPTEQEIKLLTKWIEAGAPWGVHWAYQPIKRPAVPEGETHPVDAYVRAKLREAKITPAAEADRYVLIKRVFYDLLGLLPTPAETDAFLNDPSPDAYERLVDQALASPHFGERWGRHWLDQARYADSDGYEKDSPRPDAWRYRDWVIESINRDQPFDEFTVEQLAGDLLPNATPEQVLATAFHRQTLTNREGGVDQEQFRNEAVFDRTETTGSVWLAHTVGCARCHNHKYDQITQAEYFQMFAFFNNADEANAKVGTSATALTEYEQKNAAHAAKLRALQAKVTKAREPLYEKLLDWEKETAARLAAARRNKAETKTIEIQTVASEGKVPFTKLDDGSWLATGKQAAKDVYTITATLPPGMISAIRLEVLPDPSLPGQGPGRSKNGNFVLSEFYARTEQGRLEFHSPKADFSQNDWPIAAALDGKTETGWGISNQFGKQHYATFQLVKPIDGRKTPQITISLAQQYPRDNHSIGRFRLVATIGETEESVVTTELKRLIAVGSEKWTNEQRDDIVTWISKFDPVASAATAELAALEASGPKPPLMDVRVLKERRQPRETRVFHRGEFLSPAEVVQAGTPEILPALFKRAESMPDRLDLARWLVSRENPLTARVIVNQFWMRLFGEGLVRTPADFGVRGDRPTHPELLDWLASEFMDQGWSRKKLIRLIMMSKTYRQRSDTRPELNEIDPRNTLLARQNRLRVEAEVVRDLHLGASGLLSRKIGGPSVFPPMPPEIATISYANNFRWRESVGEDRYRRGMYTFFKRTAPYPDLMTFDCPDANVAAIRRTVSNTPLQALTTLNAGSFSEAARALAARLTKQVRASDADRLAEAFRAALVRPPREDEKAKLLSLLEESRSYFTAHAEDAQKLADTKGQAPEIAAWTTVTRIILNTDEFITRD